MTMLSLFAAGMATFALLYCVQPLMPALGAAFGRSPVVTSLSLSVTTGVLALAMLGASALSDAVGRKKIMVASVFASAGLALLCAAAPDFATLLVLRALMGVALSGLPAIAMAYVGEEMAEATGLVMGLYIAGSVIGGMTGRLLAGALADWFGWRAAVGAIGVEAALCGGLLALGLPRSRHFVARPLHPGRLLRSFRQHLRRPRMRTLFGLGGLLMGGFIATYNFIGYRLLAPPYRLSQTQIGLIFTVYLAGVVSSAVMGGVARRLGRQRVVAGGVAVMGAGLALTLARPLPLVVAGVAVLTAGFFAAHSVVSAWVATEARQARAQASALYLFFYYVGSSVAGSAAGLAWQGAGWPGVCELIALLLLVALGLARTLPADSRPHPEVP